MMIAHKNGIETTLFEIEIKQKMIIFAIAVNQNLPKNHSCYPALFCSIINPTDNISDEANELPTSIKPVLTVSTETRINKIPAGRANKAHAAKEYTITICHSSEINKYVT